MICGHGGNVCELAKTLGCDPGDITDMSSNINPLGPPPALRGYLQDSLSLIEALPEPDAATLISEFAAHFGVSEDRVLAGNGTTQFIYGLPRALKPWRAMVFGPTYADYADACAMEDIPLDWVTAERQASFRPDLEAAERVIRDAGLIYICNPNNPTGALLPARDIERLCLRFPEKLFVVDESYMPFVSTGEADSILSRSIPNAIVLHSISKIFAVPGLRVGFVVAAPGIIEKLRRFQQPWSVNALAQAATRFLLVNPTTTLAHVIQTRDYIDLEMERLCGALSEIPDMTPFPGAASFCLVALPDGLTDEEVYRYLGEKRILIRRCSNIKGLSNRFIRISLKDRASNRAVVRALQQLCRAGDEARPETKVFSGAVT